MKSEPLLIDFIVEYFGGHFVSLHLAIQDAARVSGWSYFPIVDRDCPLTLETKNWNRALCGARTLGLTLVLRCWHDRQYLRALKEAVHQGSTALRLGVKLAREIGNAATGSDEVIFHLEWFNSLHLIAVWLALTILRVRRHSSILLWLPMHQGLAGSALSTKSARVVLKLIKLTTPLKVTAFTDDGATDLSASLRVEVKKLPYPLNSQWMERIGSKRENRRHRAKPGSEEKKLICWLPGQRLSQGVTVASAILSHPSALDLGAQIIELRAPQIYCQDIPSPNLGLKILPNWLGPDDFVELLLASDVVLLPYERERYRTAESGLFLEAVIAGTLPIVSEGTSMAKELRKFGLSELVLDWNRDFSWLKICELAKDINIYQRLINMAVSYEAEHGIASFSFSIRQALLSSSSICS